MILFASNQKNNISVLSADDLKRRIADKIFVLRKQKNYSQTDMAEKFGISQMAYGKIESCKTDINMEKLFIFCEIFQITLTELLGLDEVISTDAHKHIAELEAEIITLKNDLAEKSLMISLLRDKLSLSGISIT